MANLNVYTKINATDYGFVSHGDTGQTHIRELQFGSIFTEAVSHLDIRNIKVGTGGYGSSDVWAPALTSTADFTGIFDGTGGAGTLIVAGGVLSLDVIGGGLDIYGWKDLGADYTDLYVQFEVKLRAGDDGLAGSGFSEVYHAISIAGESATDNSDDGVFLEGALGGDPPGWSDYYATGNWDATPTVDTWITVSVRWQYAAPPALLTLTPTSGYAGDLVNAKGTNFNPSSALTATFDGTPVTICGQTTTNSSGAFAGTVAHPNGASFAVPRGIAPGTYTVVFTDAGGKSGSAPFTVVATTPGIRVLKGVGSCLGIDNDGCVVKTAYAPVATPWWMQFDFMLPAATAAFLAGRTSSADLLQLGPFSFTDSGRNGFSIYAPSNFLHPPFRLSTDWSGTPFGSINVDTWYTIGLAYDGSNLVWSLDGAALWTDSGLTGIFALNGSFEAGAIFAFEGDAYYFDNFKVGTSLGASDIFCADMETGTLGAFDSILGAACVADDPLGTGGPSTGCPVRADFAIAVAPSTLSFPAPGTETADVTLTAIGAPETVTLSLDLTGLPPGFTGAITPTSASSDGGTATVTITADALPSCAASYSFDVQGTDGFNTHVVTVPVTVGASGAKYDGRQTPPAILGEPFGQGNALQDSTLIVHRGELYCLWTEFATEKLFGGSATLTGYGPYLAVWRGGAWLVLEGPIETITMDTTGYPLANPMLASDGTNLYLAYTGRYPVDQSNCRGGGTITMTNYWARVWRYDGALTDLGYFAAGRKVSALPASVTMAPWLLSTNFSGVNYGLDLTASPDEVGSCYLGVFETGHNGTDVNYALFSQAYIVGFDGASGTLHDFTSLFPTPYNTSPGGFCTAGCTTPDWYFQLVGSGANLTMYCDEFDLWAAVIAAMCSGTPTPRTKIKVWQPSGFLADISLPSTVPSGSPFFGSLAYSNIGGTLGAFHASDAAGGLRYITVPALLGGSVQVGYQFASSVAAPSITGDAFSSGCDVVYPHGHNFSLRALLAEIGNLYDVTYGFVDNVATGDVYQTTAQCAPCQSVGGYDFTGIGHTLGRPTVFDDSIVMPYRPGSGISVAVSELPITREARNCCLPGGLGAIHISERAIIG